jgi:cell division protein FtsI (penicillin-binding protein 3)
MAVNGFDRRPRSGATAARRSETRGLRLRRTQRSPGGAAEVPELRLHRSVLIGVLMTIPLLAALLGFGRQQGGTPIWPSDPTEPTIRGALLTRDERVLAVGPANARRYPQGTLAGPLIGFVGARQPDGRWGLEGLEYTLDAELESGRDVHLTIDAGIQAAAEAHLAEAVARTQATAATAIVLEVGTGNVLAAASAPGFDVANWRSAPEQDRRNLALVHNYEPGSVMKPFVVATLLDAGRLSPDEPIPSPATIQIGQHVFRDVVSHPDLLTPRDVLHFSSNTGTIELAQRLGRDELHAALRAFGFGLPVEIGPVFAAEGSLRPASDWVRQDHASIAIGQGVSATNLQLAAAYAVLAQDGVYVTPRLLADEPVTTAARQVIGAEAAQEIRSMLRHTMEAGSLRSSMIPGVPTGGKTGTADVYDPVTRGYPPGRYALSFAGMFPIDAPQVVVVVTVHEPKLPATSTTVAAPLFKAIGSEVVAHWVIDPSAPAWARADGR